MLHALSIPVWYCETCLITQGIGSINTQISHKGSNYKQFDTVTLPSSAGSVRNALNKIIWSMRTNFKTRSVLYSIGNNIGYFRVCRKRRQDYRSITTLRSFLRTSKSTSVATRKTEFQSTEPVSRLMCKLM